MGNRGSRPRPGRAVLGAALASALLAGPARPTSADGIRPAPPNATWRTECGACHVPYPPALLPARAWHELMAGLDRHFGTDASLDAAAAAEITAFLERNGGRDRGGPATIRITETPWFRREHRKVPPATWSAPAVKSAANCAACHPAAERGAFDDDTVRVPR